MGSEDGLFDRQAASYAEFRPSYPEGLYQQILKFCDFKDKPNLALDVATGSGQAAVVLAEYFAKVIAIDSSVEQLKQAKSKDNITYQKGLAEQTGVASSSVDLIAVAQALHWFNHPKFFAECSRVLKAGGTFAAWGYGYPRCSNNQQVSDLIADFGDSNSKMGPYWAPERRHIVEEYANIKPPDNHFQNVTKLKLVSPCSWTIDTLVGYLSSWSPYSTWRHKHPEKEDPLIAVKKELLEACNARDGSFGLDIEFPIFVMMAKHH